MTPLRDRAFQFSTCVRTPKFHAANILRGLSYLVRETYI
jgi:hypothetical protein